MAIEDRKYKRLEASLKQSFNTTVFLPDEHLNNIGCLKKKVLI